MKSDLESNNVFSDKIVDKLDHYLSLLRRYEYRGHTGFSMSRVASKSIAPLYWYCGTPASSSYEKQFLMSFNPVIDSLKGQVWSQSPPEILPFEGSSFLDWYLEIDRAISREFMIAKFSSLLPVRPQFLEAKDPIVPCESGKAPYRNDRIDPSLMLRLRCFSAEHLKKWDSCKIVAGSPSWFSWHYILPQYIRRMA